MPTPKRAYQPHLNDSCKKMSDLILSYLTDRLSPSFRREFEQHLRICPDCVNFLNTYKKTVLLTGSMNAREIPQNVRSNVLAFLRRKMHGIAMFFFSLITQWTS
jgi:putative zinc finger protein